MKEMRANFFSHKHEGDLQIFHVYTLYVIKCHMLADIGIRHL